MRNRLLKKYAPAPEKKKIAPPPPKEKEEQQPTVSDADRILELERQLHEAKRQRELELKQKHDTIWKEEHMRLCSHDLTTYTNGVASLFQDVTSAIGITRNDFRDEKSVFHGHLVDCYVYAVDPPERDSDDDDDDDDDFHTFDPDYHHACLVRFIFRNRLVVDLVSSFGVSDHSSLSQVELTVAHYSKYFPDSARKRSRDDKTFMLQDGDEESILDAFPRVAPQGYLTYQFLSNGRTALTGSWNASVLPLENADPLIELCGWNAEKMSSYEKNVAFDVFNVMLKNAVFELFNRVNTRIIKELHCKTAPFFWAKFILVVWPHSWSLNDARDYLVERGFLVERRRRKKQSTE